MRFPLLCAALLAAALLCLTVASSADAGKRAYGRYGHNIVPYVPDSTGYVVIAPSGPGPWEGPRQKWRERPYDDGLYDSHGGWQAQWYYAPRYPWGWFGAERHPVHSTSQNPHGERTEIQIRGRE